MRTEGRVFFPKLVALITLVLLCTSASAQLLKPVYCFVIALISAMSTVGGSLVLLMIVYAAVKYVYNADDPGARKQAVSMIVNAIIAGILLLIAYAIFYTGAFANIMSMISDPAVYNLYNPGIC